MLTSVCQVPIINSIAGQVDAPGPETARFAFCTCAAPIRIPFGFQFGFQRPECVPNKAV